MLSQFICVAAWSQPQGRAYRQHHSKLRPLARTDIHTRTEEPLKKTHQKSCLDYLSACSFGLAIKPPGRAFLTTLQRPPSFHSGACEETPRARPRATSGVEEFYRRRRRQPRRPRRRALDRTLPPRQHPGPPHYPGSRRRTMTAATATDRARRPRLSCSF